MLVIAAAFAAGAIADDPATPEAHAAWDTPHLSGDWLGGRTWLEDRGLTFDIKYTTDYSKSLHGGLDTAGSRWRSLVDISATLDTKPLLGLEGGTLFADFQSAQGPNASDELVGDIQGVDGLDGVPGAPQQNRTQVSQLWYQQIALDGALRIKVGKVDANTEFDHVNAAQEFLHQSAGSSATLFTLPTYPDPAMAINVFVKPHENLQLGFGIYNGSLANGTRTGDRGPGAVFPSADDLFLIGEIDASWTLGRAHLPGRLGVGGWYSTNTFARFDGAHASGTGAPYALLEQALWRASTSDDHDARGVTLFLMYGYSDPAIVPFDHNLGGGLAWTGPIPGRASDIAGVGAQAVHFSSGYDARASSEISYEVFYRLQLKPALAIKPDLQFIANPGGKGTPDALLLSVRFEIVF